MLQEVNHWEWPLRLVVGAVGCFLPPSSRPDHRLPKIKAADILSLTAASKAERRKLLFFSVSKFFTSPIGFLCSSVERTHIYRRDLQTVVTTVAIGSIMIIRLSFGFS